MKNIFKIDKTLYFANRLLDLKENKIKGITYHPKKDGKKAFCTMKKDVRTSCGLRQPSGKRKISWTQTCDNRSKYYNSAECRKFVKKTKNDLYNGIETQNKKKMIKAVKNLNKIYFKLRTYNIRPSTLKRINNANLLIG